MGEEAISKCWQYNGFHVYGAGPCFDTYEQALAYKEKYDECAETTGHSLDWEFQGERVCLHRRGW